MEHSAQGKRSDTLGPPVLEQSRPERAKALLCALDFYQSNKHKAQAQNASSNGGDASRVGKIKAKAHR